MLPYVAREEMRQQHTAERNETTRHTCHLMLSGCDVVWCGVLIWSCLMSCAVRRGMWTVSHLTPFAVVCVCVYRTVRRYDDTTTHTALRQDRANTTHHRYCKTTSSSLVSSDTIMYGVAWGVIPSHFASYTPQMKRHNTVCGVQGKVRQIQHGLR